MCTGNGCIGIACAVYMPDATVDLVDLSPEALELAQKNVELHEVGSRVNVICSDLFEALEDRQYDLIVSNPPYVDAEDFAEMPDEYHHEPELALASGRDGLNFTRRLLREAEQYLSEEGVLVVEVGNSWLALERAFPNVPFVWLEFTEGDAGVFVLSRNELLEHRESFT